MTDFRSFETVEDVLSDDSFPEYCSGKNASLVAQWEDWIRAFPEKKVLVVQAKQLLAASIVAMDDEKDSLKELCARLAAEETITRRPVIGTREAEPESKPKIVIPRFFFLRVAVAAFLLALIAFLLLLKPFGSGEAYLRVKASKIIEVYLPDSSLMVLNKGTSVRYPATTNGADENIKVFLDEGEVFFSMNEEAVSTLTVLTATGLQVHDIGTEFSVKSYRDLVEDAIQVQEGMVTISRNDGSPVNLARNQALRIDKRSGEYSFSKADRLSTSGWAAGDVALYDVRFDEAAAALGRVFKRKIVLADSALSRLRVTMLFTTDQRLEDILETLSVIYNLTITYEEDEYITIAFGKKER